MTTAQPGFAAPRPSTRPAARAIHGSAAAVLIATMAACSATAAPSATPGATGAPPTGAPTAGPTTTAAPTDAANPLGAKDILLRYEEGGGFVPIEWNATNAPSFTLYGDGTLVFKDPYAVLPEAPDGLIRIVPFVTAKLDEASIQALLDQALGQGGLAVAGPRYDGMVIDGATSTFTIRAGGETKQVSVNGLSPDAHPQNAAIVGQLATFAAFLRNFADQIATEQPYIPTAYRSVLIDVEQPAGPVRDWPWTDLTPDDFETGEAEFWRTRTMTPAEVEALGIDGITGGLMGVPVQFEGKVYTFSLRPLLPDEDK